MAVSYVQDPSELARIVQQGLMGGMQLRQRRDAMQIQEAELDAQRARDLVRQQQAAAQFGLDQEKFAADEEQRAVGNTVSNAYLSLANSKFAAEKEKTQADRDTTVKTTRALQARIIDNFTKAGQADPATIGHIWDTGDIETLRGWERKSSEAAQGKATLEGMRKSAQKMKPFIDNIVKPDGTPDVATQARLRFLADDVNNEDDYKRLWSNYDQVTKMQGEAATQAAMDAQSATDLQAQYGIPPEEAQRKVRLNRSGIITDSDTLPTDPAGGQRAAIAAAKSALDVARQNLSAVAEYADSTEEEDGQTRLTAAQRDYDAAYEKYQAASAGGVPRGTQAPAQGGDTPAGVFNAFFAQHGRAPTREEWAQLKPGGQ